MKVKVCYCIFFIYSILIFYLFINFIIIYSFLFNLLASKSNKNVGKGAFDADSYVSQHVSSYVNGNNSINI